jgi:V8-like Glu-specific endopeptidase
MKGSWISYLALLCAGIILTSCGILPKQKTKTIVLDPKNPQYLSLANIENAPQTVRAASKAVVSITSYMGSGTGSFVNKDGLLMTNDHVLGSKVCAKSGCYITLQKNYEAGSKSVYSSMAVFAEPKAVSESLDVAFLQIYSLDPNSKKPGPKLSTEHFLEFTRETTESLKGKTIHIVGHPASGLKKWSFGEVFETNGDWFRSEAQVLPGSSGSPILNPEGKIVGILHRSASNSLSDITQVGIRDFSIGTASSPLMDLMGILERSEVTQLALLTDITKSTTKDKFIKDSEIYLNSHANEVVLDIPALNPGSPSQTKVHPADIIADAIDMRILAAEDTKTVAQIQDLLDLAILGSSWISCQSQPKGETFRLCPGGDQKEKWILRIETIMEKTKEMNWKSPVNLISYFAYALSSSTTSGQEAAVKSIMKHSGSELNFTIASLLLSFSEGKSQPKFGTIDLESYVMNFESIPKYEHYYTDIIRSLGSLYGVEFISQSELSSKINLILRDPKTTLRERIRAEKLAFSAGLL